MGEGATFRPQRKEEENDLNGSNSAQRESTLAESIESVFLLVRDGLCGVLLVMTKKNSATLSGTALQTLIDLFQLLALTMLPDTLAVVDTDGYLSIFASFFQLFNFGSDMTRLFGFKVSLGIVTGIVICELVNIAYVAHSWIKKTFDHLWAIKLLRYTTSLLIGILYIPMVSVMGVLLSCSTNTNLIEEGLCVTLRPFICAVLAVFICVSLLLSSAYITSSPASGSPASKAHSRVDIVHLVVKTAASLLSATFSQRFRDEPGLHLAWHGFLAASGILLALLNVWYLPWFHPTIARLRAVCMCLFGWFALAIFASVLTNVSSSTFLFMMSCVGALPFFHSLVQRRRKHLSKKTLLTCRDSYEFELIVRQKLLDHKIIFSVGRQRVLPDQTKDEEEETTQSVLQEIESMYNLAMKQFPSSARICIFYAEFCCAFDLPSSNLQVRKAIIEGERRQPGFASTFTLFKLRHMLKQKVAKDGDVMSYVASEKYEREAVHADKKACTLLLEFWRELGARQPNMGKVRKLAAQAADFSHRANVAYGQLLKVKPKSIDALGLYSGFLADVTNDRKKAVQMSQRMQSLSQKGNHQGNDRGESELSDLFPVVSFNVVGGESLFGEILTANDAAGEFLNESNERLLRRDVRNYFLPEFAEKLPILVSEFFDSGKIPFHNETKHAFVIASNGDCSEVELRFIPYTTDGMEYSFFATWARTKYPASKTLTPHCFLLVKDLYEIVAYSHECREMLDLLTYHQNPQSVDEIFTDFKQTIEMAQTKKQFHHIPFSFSFPNPTCREISPGVHTYISIEVVDEFLKVTFQPLWNDLQQNSPIQSPTLDGEDAFDKIEPFASATEGKFNPEEASLRTQHFRRTTKSAFLSGSRRNFAIDGGQKTHENSSPLPTSESKRNVYPGQITKSPSKSRVVIRAQSLDAEEDNHSHNSVNSSSSLSAAAIRSALQSQSNDNRLSPILARLKRSYIIMLLMALGCASVVLIVQNSLLASFVDNIRLTTLACLRRGATVAIAFSVHSLLMHNVGIQQPSMFDESKSREDLRTAALLLKDLDEELFNERARYSTELRQLYESPTTPLLISLNTEATKTYFTMYEASSVLSAKAIQAYETNLSEFTIDSDLVFTLVNNVNGDDTYLDALFTSSAKFSSETEGLHGTILKITLITISIAMAIELVVLFAVMNPIVSGIEQNKTRVLDVFAGIPLGTVKDIASRYLDRLTNTHGIVVEGVEDEDGYMKVQIASTPTNSEIEAEPLPSTKKTTVVPASAEVMHSKRRGHRKKALPKKAKKRRSGAIASRYAWFLFQLGSAVLLSAVYFGISLQYGQQAVMNRFQDVPGQVYDFASIRAEVRYALHMLRLFTSQTDFESAGYDLHVSKSHLGHVLEEVQAQRHLVVNGDATQNLQGLLNEEDSPAPDLLTLMFSNGCHRWDGGTPLSDCENFDSGVLRSGLNTAITEYTDSIQVFMKKFADDYIEDEGDSTFKSVINNSSFVSTAFMSEDFLTLARLEELYLKPQLTMTQTILAEEVTKGAGTSASIRLASFITYVCTLLVLYFMIVKAVIKSLDSEVKHTRSLLLMIPEDALDGLKSVQKFLTEEFKNSNL